MKKINILAAIMALGLVLGFASCDLDKDSTSAELDDDAVALVANQIYLTPDSSKGIKVTLLYNENDTSFWSDYRYTKLTVYKVVTGGSNVQQLTFSVQEDGQVPTAEEPEKIIYYPFTEAGETYSFGFNGASKDVEATSGIGEVLNVPSNPTLSYTTSARQRLFKASGCTVESINNVMDDVTDTYDIDFQFNVHYYNYGSPFYAWTWVTGMGDETGTGAGDFFTDLFSTSGADILSSNSGYLWNDRDYIDSLLMSGSSYSYKQNKFYIQGEFIAKVLLDETKYGSCTYFIFDINSPYGQTYYSKNAQVSLPYVYYYDTWTNGIGEVLSRETRYYNDTWQYGIARDYNHNLYVNFRSDGSFNYSFKYNSDGSYSYYDENESFIKRIKTDSSTSPYKTYWYTEDGAFLYCTATDTWNGVTRNWSYDSTGAFVSCTGTDTYSLCSSVTRNWIFDSTGAFVSCTGTDTWTTPASTIVTRNWIFDTDGTIESCTAVDSTTGITYMFNKMGHNYAYVVTDSSFTPARDFYYDYNGNLKFAKAVDTSSTPGWTYYYYYDDTDNLKYYKKTDGSNVVYYDKDDNESIWWNLSSHGSPYYFVRSGNEWTSNNNGKSNTTASSTWTLTTTRDITVSIPYSVSSEASYDKLTILLDDVTKVNAISGQKSGTITETLSAGTHTLYAQYYKDGSVDSYNDCGVVTLNIISGSEIDTTGEIDELIQYYSCDWELSPSGSSYYFVQSGNTWTSNNKKVDSTTASSTWTINLMYSAEVEIPYSVSSESGFDKLTILLDGVTKVSAISGQKSGTITATMSAGTHTLYAQYYKDRSSSYYNDCGVVTLNTVVLY